MQATTKIKGIKGIKGFLGTSLIDYPEKVAAVVFLGGCNLRCPFCHNSVLVQDGAQLEDLQVEELIDGLLRRRKLLEGVVVTGGEPTLHPQLHELLGALKSIGLAVKVDTNGLRPDTLVRILEQGTVDYLAVDVKVAPERYPAVLGGSRESPARLRETIRLLSGASIAYEYRTTCVPGLVTEADIIAIARLIRGAPRYMLQQYVPVHVLDPELAERPPYPAEVLDRFLNLARPHVRMAGLRNL